MRYAWIAGIATVSVAGIVYFLQPKSANAAPTSPPDLREVSVVRTSEDARETFRFRMYRPWPDAPHRVIIVDAVAVENSGFVSHAYVHANDLSDDEAFTAGGPRSRMIVRRNASSWSAVQSEDDLTVLVEAGH
jgi:hypothetical protein